MANPFLTSAPYDPRGGFGFQRPPTQPMLPYDPGGTMPIGLDTPVGRLGICPPGTRCAGASGRILGQTFCLGGCVATPPQVLNGLPVDPGQPRPPADWDPAMPLGTPYAKKRKRMNYSNQKALRRALRRATGYARQQKSIRKAAGEFAREFGPKRSARRDLGRGHTHVK